MFGQSGNTSFGFNAATQSSPFGQSAFGKPIATTSFGTGAAPVFGSSTPLFSSKPAGATTGGLFGNTAAAPAFGQPATTQSSFGAFGNTSTNTNLFGTQQNANANPFGAAAPAFGQTNKPGTFGFGSTTGTGLFGQTQQPNQQPTPFGQPSTAGNTGLFGNAGGFGGANATSGMTGTVVKFTPVTGTDTMIKNAISQTISTRHNCITCMKEYESKSLEELRLEDYTAGRKGTTQGQTTGLFGAPAQQTPFGTVTAGATSTTGFGSLTSGFGATSQPAGGGLFAKPITGFGSTTTTTSTFPFNTTTTSGLFGSNSQNKPFGTSTAPLFSAPGNTQAPATGFGTINGTQNTGFGTGFGTTQANQSIGLFNQSKPAAFNLPSSTSSTGFGTFASTTNTGTGLFGQNKPAGTTGFGTSTGFAAPATSTFGNTMGFGTMQGASPSLFNTSFKPAGTAPFSFGNTSTATTGLGTNTGLNLTGGNLFGQQKPGLFGTPGTGTFNSTGAFGSAPAFGTNTSTMPSLGMNILGGGLGTNQNQPSSGSVPVHQQILALVSAPFGDSPLLKNLLPASGKAEELLKPANPAARTLSSPQYKISTNNQSPKVKAKAVTAAQLSKKSLFEGLEEEDPSLMEAFQPRPNAKRLVLRPKSVTNLSLQQASDDNVNVVRNMNDSEKSDTGEANNSKSNDLETTNKENDNRECNRPSSVERRSSSAWLKTALPRKTRDDELANPQSPFCGADIQEEVLENTVAELRPQSGKQSLSQSVLSCASPSISPNISLGMDKSIADSTGRDSDSGQELDETPLSALQPEGEPNAAKVKLRRVGYYTIPPLDKLNDYARGETCIVPNFTVGRKGYGNVYFPDSFDIYGLDLDEIVHFRHKEVIIYPDDEKKPPIGQGLNRRAQVTLDRVWPHDKSLHKPITDPYRLTEMNYEGKLRRVSAKHDTRFLEYRPETGSWVFKVEHFSKYGLSDSDDDDNDVANNVDPKKLKENNFQQKPSSASKTLPPTIDKSVLKSGKQIMSGLNGTLDDQSNGFSRHTDFDSDMLDDDMMAPFILPSKEYSHEKQSALSPTSVYARIIGTDSHKLQLMKASFFDTSRDDIEDAVCGGIQRLLQKDHMLDVDEFMNDSHALSLKTLPLTRYHVKLQTDSSVLDTRRFRNIEDVEIKKMVEDSVVKFSSPLTNVFPAPVIQPQTVVLKYKSEVIPFKDSIISKLRSRCIADTGVQMGRKFRPSWGPGLTLISLSTREQASNIPLQNSVSQLGSYVSGRLLDDTTSMSIVQRLQILGGRVKNCDYGQIFQESIEGHLRIQLDHCIMGQEGDCPMIGVQKGTSGVAALHAHCNLAQELVDKKNNFTLYTSNVWKLCAALWGNLPDIESSDDVKDHKCVMVRKEALGEWLRNVAEENLQQEIAELDNDESIILSLLSANKLEEACYIARKTGDYCLALLISQLEGSTAVRELVKQQLAFWQETDVDENLSIEHLKLYMLVAGEPLICSKQGTINVCERLDWKRVLALHLWYLSSPTASIADALELYETSFDTNSAEAYAVEPRPDYSDEDYDTEVSAKEPIYDLCFHLLKLYCTGNHPLEVLLNPMTHTADPLDYRLSWLIQQALVALGYSYLSSFASALTHTNFAAQLETYDMWHWAIFVLLHLEDIGRRRHAVLELLSRHVQLSEDPEYVRREDFLREELGIPSIWINQAKAVKACAMKRYGEAAWYLIQAEQWNKAHEVIIEYLAADAIINENYEYLKSLLSPLIPSECNRAINGWAHQGQLLWDYMGVTVEIESLLESGDFSGIGYKLELLQPQLTSLCTKINQFPCPTAKHRLCQAEISKRTLQLARSLLLLKSNDNVSTGKVLFNLISQLPLPEDYAQQELRPIINMRVNEIISN